MSEKESLAIGRGKPGPGRKKGVPNKINADIRQMILTALSDLGGAKYLKARGEDPRTAPAFMALVGKALPTQVTGAGDGPIQIARIELVALDQSTGRTP